MRRHRLWAILALLLAALSPVALLACSFGAREKALLALLVAAPRPAQPAVLRALREYPTKTTALALLAYANMKRVQRAPEKDEAPQEAVKRAKRARADERLSLQALETLAHLSGEDFGREEWALTSANAWALRKLGGVDLGAAAGAFSAAVAEGMAAAKPGEGRLSVHITISSTGAVSAEQK